VTAETLAQELEVSVRTIYRDMEALSVAGIPVYAERGPGGGCCLIDEYRTTLTGLTDEEARSLYMLDIPAPLEALGVGRQLKTALLKLYASLPAYRQNEAEASQRVYLDWAWWGQGEQAQPVLEVLYAAVWKGVMLKLTYLMFNGQQIEQEAAPLGLVSKAGMWYLVCQVGEKISSLRVVDLLEVKVLEQAFERPPGFNLPAYWQQFSRGLTEGFYHFEVQVMAVQMVLPHLQRYFSYFPGRMAVLGEPDEDGCIPLVLYYESFEVARAHLLGLGNSVKVLAPRALRLSLADFAVQTVSIYREG
jgi:predicted DNA-binding transcriptional regulator YafY